PSANVTASTNTSNFKVGTCSSSFVVAAAFTTGKIAYKALGSTVDYSAYQQLSFWFLASTVVAANSLKLCLCSDTTGDTIVDEFVIPVTDVTSYKYCFTINKGSALGSSIQSVALYAIVDPGTPTILLDNIIACKASSSADALSLTSLISKNPAASGGDEGWYPIQSINGTTVTLDNGPAINANAGRGYYGTTETAATYKRECFRVLSATCTIQDSGSSGSLIAFQGGYDPTTGNQDGETYFDIGSGRGNGIDFTNRNYVLSNKINMVRAMRGVCLYTASYCEVTAHSMCGNDSAGIYIYGASFCKLDVKNANNNTGTGLSYGGTNNVCNELTIGNVNNNTTSGMSVAAAYVNKITAENVCNNGSSNVSINANAIRNTLKIMNDKNSGSYGFSFDSPPALDNKIIGTTTASNASGAVSASTPGTQYFNGCTFGETSKVLNQTAWQNGRICLSTHDGSPSNNYVYTDGGIISSQSSVRHTESGIAWQLSPTSANRSTYYPLFMSLAKIAVAADSQVTVSCWFRRSDTGITGKLICRGGQIAGVIADVSASMTAAADTWEQLSITFTPTATGVVEIEAWAFGGTAYSVYVEDILISDG
ncbi:MAG: hypothetical protein Q7U74_10205, partial [Saprospiraceae bacterium]|nr:hypothetical protein [Saprospiraceae bacterium]